MSVTATGETAMFPTVDKNDPNHDNIMSILSEDDGRNFNITRVIEFLDRCDMLSKI